MNVKTFYIQLLDHQLLHFEVLPCL